MKGALQGNQRGRQTGRKSTTTRVLYVEHDDDNLYMLKTRLERCGGAPGKIDYLAAASGGLPNRNWLHHVSPQFLTETGKLNSRKR